jgi:citrate lyase alpha subunit
LVKQQVTVPEIIKDIGDVLNNITLVLNDHEQRLRLIQEVDLKIELELLGSRIAAISDTEKQTEALQALKNLCDSLGIADVDLPQA